MPPYAKVEKTPSLKDTLSKIDSIGKVNEESVQTQETTSHKDLPRESFTQAQLTEKWEVFVERLKKTEVRMYSALRKIEPKLISDNQIELVFQNSAQIEEYKLRLRPSLINELKETFNNHYIELVERLAESENMLKPNLLSNKEILEKMITKNPALDSLRKKFNLDFD